MRLAPYAATLLAAMACRCGGRSATPGAGATPGDGAVSSHPALWSKHVGPGEVSGVAFDGAGNLVATGTIQGNFDASLGGGTGDPLRADGFVAAFDHAGHVMWMHRWANLGGTHVGTLADAVIANESGVWVLGVAWPGVVDLGGGSLSVPDNAQVASSPFVTHYTGSGALVSFALLAMPTVCQTSQCRPEWMGLDDAGNAYWTTTPLADSSPGGEALLTKSDTQGHLLWTLSMPRGPSASGVSVSGSGVSAVSDGGALTVVGPDGPLRWTKQFPGGAVAGPVGFDGVGDVIVGGAFQGAVDLGGPAPLQSPANDSEGQSIFLVKYDASGNYIWSRAFGSTPRAQSSVGAVRVASNEDVLFTGAFAGAADFGTGTLRASSDSADIGSHDVFLARLDPGGGARWSAAFGGNGLGDAGSCLAVAPDGRVAIGGRFDGTIDFGHGTVNAVADYGSQWGPGGDGFVAIFYP